MKCHCVSVLSALPFLEMNELFLVASLLLLVRHLLLEAMHLFLVASWKFNENKFWMTYRYGLVLTGEGPAKALSLRCAQELDTSPGSVASKVRERNSPHESEGTAKLLWSFRISSSTGPSCTLLLFVSYETGGFAFFHRTVCEAAEPDPKFADPVQREGQRKRAQLIRTPVADVERTSQHF